MNFERAVNFLESFKSYQQIVDYQYDEENFNLSRFKSFLKDFNVQLEKLKFIHVAGSKGKGTVSTFLAKYLREKGKAVGLFTSPYLNSICESFWTHDGIISENEFSELVFELKKFLETEDGVKYQDCTYFEFLVALVLKYFTNSGLEYAILEVGMGGRLDATNIVSPIVSVVTRIEEEHLGILGDNLSEIVGEKLGIVKDKIPVTIGQQSEEVMKILNDDFDEVVQRACLFENEVNFFVRQKSGCFLVDLLLDGIEVKDLKIKSFVNIENFGLALLILKELFEDVDLEVFRIIAEGFSMKGRFQTRLFEGESVVFDMAHTVASIESLLSSLKVNFPDKEFLFLYSTLRDKKFEDISILINNFATGVVLTEVELDRKLPMENLKEFFSTEKLLFCEQNSRIALKKLLATKKENQIVVVTGSHYLLKELS